MADDYYDRKVARADEVAGLWLIGTTVLFVVAMIAATFRVAHRLFW